LDAAYRVCELSFSYRSLPWARPREALRGVSMVGSPGEIRALVGANGAGKTTLIRHLAGLLRARQGEVSVLGGKPDGPDVRGRVAYLPDAHERPSRLRVREAVELQAAFYGIARAERRVRGERALDEVGLLGLAARPLSALSRGQRRRVSLAQAFVPDAELLLLDEPWMGVDPVACEQIRERLKARSAAGAAVVVSSHSLADVEGLCDRVSLLHEAALLADGSPDEVLGREGEWWVTLSYPESERREREEQCRALGAREPPRRARRSLAEVLRGLTGRSTGP